VSINRQYRTDRNRETEGVTIEYTDAEGNVLAWFKCKRPGGRNAEFQKVLNKKLREHRQEMSTVDDLAKEKLLNRIYAEVFAEAVILDWGGDIEGKDGNSPAECTYENIVWLFLEDCPDLFDNLQMRLNTRQPWRPEDKEVAAKN